ncbi:protein containing Peptidase S41 domain, partial [sediment metagenome]
IIVEEDYQGKEENIIWESGDNHFKPSLTTNIFNNLKLGILINEGSASASEILAGSLLDHKKAIIFGENSFGKGTVQELVTFSNGSSMKVTVAKFILPNGE